MNRSLKALGLIALITLFASCKKDDGADVTPPRDYTVQYAAEKVQIEEYMQTHYMTVDANFNVTFDTLVAGSGHVSIWDQTDYPKISKNVYSVAEANVPLYTLYYIVLQQGVGIAPTRADNVKVAYRGQLFDGTQFDYNPLGETPLNLSGTIEGWQEIIPMFRPGVYVDEPGSPNPPSYQNYGAGVMFVPSGLAYYNSGSGNVGAYEPLIFSFKLHAAEYLDADSDGILNINERESEFSDPFYYNTDKDKGDVTLDHTVAYKDGYAPNYLDPDDDDDGFSTQLELIDPDTDEEYPSFEAIRTNICSDTGTIKVHLDPTCHPE
ncbi:FKBP-type peptidyl-prolyl cis-trans isomerase [Flavobacterium sp. RHBU_24]|uniref:FKBP-type peptidyl-prolyl cis-trans isomerase n=1 Tax=Flavobacterium sp. RHBU_24 TaxID=3391185 RepID=UPI0039854247